MRLVLRRDRDRDRRQRRQGAESPARPSPATAGGGEAPPTTRPARALLRPRPPIACPSIAGDGKGGEAPARLADDAGDVGGGEELAEVAVVGHDDDGALVLLAIL